MLYLSHSEAECLVAIEKGGFFARNLLMHKKWKHYEKCLLMDPYHTSF